jgi:hypothetical protein
MGSVGSIRMNRSAPKHSANAIGTPAARHTRKHVTSILIGAGDHAGAHAASATAKKPSSALPTTTGATNIICGTPVGVVCRADSTSSSGDVHVSPSATTAITQSQPRTTNGRHAAGSAPRAKSMPTWRERPSVAAAPMNTSVTMNARATSSDHSSGSSRKQRQITDVNTTSTSAAGTAAANASTAGLVRWYRVLVDDRDEARAVAGLLLAVMAHHIGTDDVHERSEHAVAGGGGDGEVEGDILGQRGVAHARLRAIGVLRAHDGPALLRRGADRRHPGRLRLEDPAGFQHGGDVGAVDREDVAEDAAQRGELTFPRQPVAGGERPVADPLPDLPEDEVGGAIEGEALHVGEGVGAGRGHVQIWSTSGWSTKSGRFPAGVKVRRSMGAVGWP